MAGCLLQQSGWSPSMDVFFKGLGPISFLGGGYGNAAFAGALVEVLMVQSSFFQQ
jgi:mediator of RNA polymerase II transcription subunit 25